MKQLYTLLILFIPLVGFGQEIFNFINPIEYSLNLNDGKIISGNHKNNSDLPEDVYFGSEPWITKLNNFNDEVWTWSYDVNWQMNNSGNKIKNIKMTSDSSFIIVLDGTNDNATEGGSRIIKISSDGQVLFNVFTNDIFSNAFGFLFDEFIINDFDILFNDDLIICGYLNGNSYNSYYRQGYIISLDSFLEVNWEYYLDNPYESSNNYFSQTEVQKLVIDENFIVASSIYNTPLAGEFSESISLTKLNFNGELIWNNTDSFNEHIEELNNVNIANITSNSNNEVFLVSQWYGFQILSKFSENGENNWNLLLSVVDSLYGEPSLVYLNNYLLALGDKKIIKIDNNGQIISAIINDENSYYVKGIIKSNIDNQLSTFGYIENGVSANGGFLNQVNYHGLLIFYGCTDVLACNYNSLATDDDGSCTYTDGICESCEDGDITDNDADNDGICDVDEIVGCTDVLACNYNSSATDDDGSCYNLSASITQSGDSLIAVFNPDFVNVSWYNVQTIDDSTRYWLMAENSASFEPTFDCSYFIIVNSDECSYTSPVYYYSSEAKSIGKLSTSPNPSDGVVKVKFENNKNQFVKLQLINNNGYLLDEFLTTKNELEIDLSSYPAGAYHVSFNSPDSKDCLNENTFQKIANTIILK